MRCHNTADGLNPYILSLQFAARDPPVTKGIEVMQILIICDVPITETANSCVSFLNQ